MDLRRTRRPLAALAAAVALLATPASALAGGGEQEYPIGSEVWNAALTVSTEIWGGLPCGGAVDYAWSDLPAGTLGYASWMAPADAPSDATQYSSCRVDLERAMDQRPAMFCTVVAHELGHLLGHEHVDEPGQLMSATLTRPAPECVSGMARFAPAPAAVEPPAPAALPPAETRAAQRAARRAARVRAARRAHRAHRGRAAKRSRARAADRGAPRRIATRHAGA